MRRASDSFRNSGAYTSPGTPEYGTNQVEALPKTWSSERVPLPTSSGSRRHINSIALTPFNNGRPLPSKWDDAERWITSPISGYGAFRNSIPYQPQRRPKSKSGPLGPTGLGYLSNYSPTVPVYEGGGKVRNFMANSPLTTGVLVPDGVSVHYDNGKIAAAKSNSFYGENNVMRMASFPGLSDMQSEASLPSSQDDKVDCTNKEEESAVSRDISRRDMATQMSPEGSTHSSSKGRLSFSTLPSSSITATSTVEHGGNIHAAKDESVRDVQIDKGVTGSKKFKKQGLKKKSKKNSRNVEELTSSTWNVDEGSRNTSMLQREEAKINAWENLQKAKADAAIQKLEMKLEKKRSASMDKIMNKLRAKQMKAQAMRNLLSNQAPRKITRRGISSSCTYFKICSLSKCFICHNFEE